MKNKILNRMLVTVLGAMSLASACVAAEVEQTVPQKVDETKSDQQPPKSPRYPSSDQSKAGDHLKLTVDVYGFIPTSSYAGKEPRCAGKGSKYSIVDNDGTDTLVKFYHTADRMSTDTCPASAAKVAEGSIYKIANSSYLLAQSKTAGIAYGVLAVPFKFRLGSDAKLISSATIAPYIGGRWTFLQGFGYEMMPVFAAGVGLVPVPGADGKSTETKSAFSSAIGLTLSSVKDPKYSAGVLYGRDFVSKSDRGNDPGVSKPWLSLWLGVAL